MATVTNKDGVLTVECVASDPEDINDGVRKLQRRERDARQAKDDENKDFEQLTNELAEQDKIIAKAQARKDILIPLKTQKEAEETEDGDEE